jgi:nucleoside 2-deoxyribosyltransferase
VRTTQQDRAIAPTLTRPSRLKHSNIQDIEDADIVVANVEAFRGTCVDDGTAFELGYAFARAKRLVVYTPEPGKALKDRMADEFSSEQRASWLKQEEFPRTEDFPGE